MSTTEKDGYDTIRGWLSRRCGIHYPDHKQDLLRQRLSRVQRAFTFGDVTEMARRLTVGNEHDLQLAVMHAASTNHTYFYREKEVLDAFRTLILPELARRDEIRIWSAACSSGDEVYTLAMLIAETLGEEALRRTSILGTDISAPMVERAEQGIYGPRHLEQAPRAILRKYLRPIDESRHQVLPEIRQACTFRRMNLKVTPYPFRKPFQAVFCRNILYYFDRDDQIATLNALHDATEPGGWLVTSVTENVRDLETGWRSVASGISRRDEA